MNPFDLNSLGGMFSGLQQKVEEMKRLAAETEVTGRSGGGLVTVRMTCDWQVTDIDITPEAYEDRELLEDLVRAAMNEALRAAKEETAKSVSAMAGGLPLPPGLLPPGLL